MEEVMQSAIRITTRVLPGNKVEVLIPPGLEGEDVEVIVVLPEKKQQSRKSALDRTTRSNNGSSSKLQIT